MRVNCLETKWKICPSGKDGFLLRVLVLLLFFFLILCVFFHSFTSPFTDGGSAVTAYAVEWNTDPGTREVQTIQSKTDVGPKMDVYVSDVPISFATTSEGNVLGGYFRLTYSGETTGDIPYDASPSDLQLLLQQLPNVGLVKVNRADPPSLGSNQDGFQWKVTFTDDVNSGERRSHDCFSRRLDHD